MPLIRTLFQFLFLAWPAATAPLALAQAPPITNEIHEVAFLKAPKPGYNHAFGTSAALSGDTLLVGAPGESRYPSPGVGTAYVFTRQADRWSQQAILKPSTNYDHFGTACGLCNDTAVVGTLGPPTKGSAFVFHRDHNLWTLQAVLYPRAAAQSDWFGTAVAITEGIVVVGASRDRSRASGVNGDATDNGGVAVGAAYVFEQTPAGWQQTAYLKPSDNRFGSYFGGSVAASGQTVVVGAWGAQGEEGSPKKDWICGAAYVFVRTNGHWLQQACLKGPRDYAGGKFGWAVAISEDTIAVGADEDSIVSPPEVRNKDGRHGYIGAVFVFEREAGQWKNTAYLTPSPSAPGGWLGECLALSGDTLAATCSFNGRTINVFQKRKGAWQLAGRLRGSNTQEEDRLGESIALSGHTAVIGASAESSGPANSTPNTNANTFKQSGAAYVFQLPAN